MTMLERFNGFGERNGRAVLTSEQILEIRSAKGLQREIADKYNVVQTTISAIKRKKLWKRV